MPRPETKSRTRDLIEPYGYLDQVVKSCRKDLAEASFAIFWMLDVKPNRDGLLTLGKCKKASDCDRELALYAGNGKKVQVDFVIFLNGATWKEHLNEKQREALMHHELCHAAVTEDKNGEPMKDERGRTCYRIRKHDIEEFRDVVERHGIYKLDLQAFAIACAAKMDNPLFETAGAGPH